MEVLSVLRIVIEVAYVLTIVGTILVVIAENQNPFRTLAWLLVLLFVPLFGLFIYYLLGQDTRRKKYFRENKKKTFTDFPAEPSLAENAACVAPAYHALVSLLSRGVNSWVLKGSRVEVLTSGEQKMAALMADLRRAKRHIHMEYFLFNNDETGREVKNILMQKAAEGVEVRFIYENVANVTVPRRFYLEMEQSGVKVSAFSKMRLPRIRHTVNYRNHRKVAVIDGEVGYIGGMNIGDEYRRTQWRDTHLRIEGQGVYGCRPIFCVTGSLPEKRFRRIVRLVSPQCRSVRII